MGVAGGLQSEPAGYEQLRILLVYQGIRGAENALNVDIITTSAP
jgi:hypothetical protein